MRGNDFGGETVVSAFNTDYTYESNMFEKPLHWRFYGDTVQVDQYPPMRGLRTDSWGWVLANAHAAFSSAELVDF